MCNEFSPKERANDVLYDKKALVSSDDLKKIGLNSVADVTPLIPAEEGSIIIVPSSQVFFWQFSPFAFFVVSCCWP